MKKKPVQIFISHSHKDKLFIEFADDVLRKGLFSKVDPSQIRFTSYEEMGILTSQNTLQLFEDVKTSKLFICFISRNYKSSEFCILEQGAAIIQALPSSKRVIFPIIPEDSDYRDTLPHLVTMIHAKINNKHGLMHIYKIAESLGIRLIDETYYEKLVINFLKKYSKHKTSLFSYYTKKDSLYENSINAFSMDSNIDFPITLFSNRSDYEKISIETSREAGNFLLWTLYNSPLQVDKAYRNSQKFLTDYDVEFKNSSARDKIRLIIFQNYKMAFDYFKCSPILKIPYSSLKKRKRDFEESNKGYLFFTTRQKLNIWYTKQYKGKKQIPKFFDYEFGFVSKDGRSEQSSYGFTSGFHSNTVNKHSMDVNYRHLVLYPYNLEKNLYDKFRENIDYDYKIFSDIPIQIDIVKFLQEKTSDLRDQYVVQGPLNSENIKKLY